MRLMDCRKIAVIGWLAICAAGVMLAQTNPTDTSPQLPVSYIATAFGQAGPLAGKSFGVTVYVTGWTSDAVVQELAATLKSKGPDGLLKAMYDMKDVGRVAPADSVGSGFRVAQIHPDGKGGYHIVMVTDRPISVPEASYAGRSMQYPFGIVTLNVDKDGKGSGILAPVCKIKFNKKNELEIEHYGQKPFRLANVQLNK